MQGGTKSMAARGPCPSPALSMCEELQVDGKDQKKHGRQLHGFSECLLDQGLGCLMTIHEA